jgi:hypothetical protein
MVQSWALCRDAYFMRVAELLAVAGAWDRLLLVSLSIEVMGARSFFTFLVRSSCTRGRGGRGYLYPLSVLCLRGFLSFFPSQGEHRVFHRLRSFVVDGTPPGDYVPPAAGEVPMKTKKHPRTAVRTNARTEAQAEAHDDGAVYPHATGVAASSSSPVATAVVITSKPAKLLRRHTNRQAYPAGLKACLASFASHVLAAAPLSIPAGKAAGPLNDPILSIPWGSGSGLGLGSGAAAAAAAAAVAEGEGLGAGGEEASAEASAALAARAFLRRLANFAWGATASSAV